ncbi:hypothetical protein ACFW1M_23140 [Streptomyces inhibens]|uniref:hypothetical protein n=1 Tax=Streptomyces inhibens TaxID=2293571 RepID=UPI0036A45CF8
MTTGEVGELPCTRAEQARQVAQGEHDLASHQVPGVEGVQFQPAGGARARPRSPS